MLTKETKMRKIFNKICLVLVALFISQFVWADQIVDANEILSKVDAVLAAPEDLSALIKISIINKNGDIKNREVQMYQKGNKKRLVKVLAPADQKGIGFLSLPDDIIYVYLPAYKKTRRIAAHIKNQKFVGTDFTYEDLEAKNYSDKWTPELFRTEKEMFVLKLIPRQEVVSEYSKIILYVRVEDYFPLKAEYYNKKCELIKIMEILKTERIKEYLIPVSYSMQDLCSGNKTEMVMSEVKLDTGLDDNLFTERNLAR